MSFLKERPRTCQSDFNDLIKKLQRENVLAHPLGSEILCYFNISRINSMHSSEKIAGRHNFLLITLLFCNTNSRVLILVLLKHALC